MGSTEQQGDRPRPARWTPAAIAPPARGLRHRCAVRGADAGRSLSREGEETPSFRGRPELCDPTPTPSQAGSFPQRNPPRPGAARPGSRKKKGARGNLKLQTGAREPGVEGLGSCGPQALRPQGTIKLSKVWKQLEA